MSDAVAPSASSSPAASPPVSYRQLLLVPAIVVPLISAVPVWFDKAAGWYNNFKVADAQESRQQLAIAFKNMGCLQTPYRSYESDAKLAIDGTVCKSGDVLLRVANERGEAALYWVSKEKLKERIAFSATEVAAATTRTAAAEPASGFRSASWSGSGLAAAPALAYSGGQSGRSPYLYYAQSQVVVLCTQRIDDRHIRQRVRRQDGCFDQVIDLANGAVVNVTPAPSCTC